MRRFWRRVREFMEAARWGGLFSFQSTIPPFVCRGCDRPARLHSDDDCDFRWVTLSPGYYSLPPGCHPQDCCGDPAAHYKEETDER